MERVLSIFNFKDAFNLLKSLFLLSIIVFSLDRIFQFFSFKLVHLSYNYSKWGLHQVEKAYREKPDVLIIGNSKVKGVNSEMLKNRGETIQVISLPGTNLNFWIKFIEGYKK